MTLRNKHDFPILDSLRSSGPNPSNTDKLMLFGQFVGVWDMEVMFCDANQKKTFDEPGEWSFAWVLDGLAVQDALTYPNPDDKDGQTRIDVWTHFRPEDWSEISATGF